MSSEKDNPLLVKLAGVQNLTGLAVGGLPDGALVQLQLSTEGGDVDASLLGLVLLGKSHCLEQKERG